MPKRSKVETRQRVIPWSSRVGFVRRAIDSTAYEHLRLQKTKTRLTEGVAAGAALMLLGQSQPEAQRPIGPIVTPKRHGGDNTGRASS